MSDTNYKLAGIKKIDDVVHAPVIEIIKMCEAYPSVTGKQLSVLLKVSLARLEKEESKTSPVPTVDTSKKSFFGRLFQ